jgi:hypothetical protein
MQQNTVEFLPCCLEIYGTSIKYRVSVFLPEGFVVFVVVVVVI